MRTHRKIALGLLAIAAALAGGFAEVVWVALYSAFTSISAIDVAHEVAFTAAPDLSWTTNAALVGLGIHLLLSLALGLAFAYFVWPMVRTHGAAATFSAAIVTLALVWAMNFLVVLPELNPGFVTMMPYTVTLISKMLFALAMAAVLLSRRIRCRASRSVLH